VAWLALASEFKRLLRFFFKKEGFFSSSYRYPEIHVAVFIRRRHLAGAHVHLN
jgi:hypothetical protein